MSENQNNNLTPPRWATWLLKTFHSPLAAEELEGDLLELFNHWVNDVGLSAARRQYIWTVIRLTKPFTKTNNSMSPKQSFRSGISESFFKIIFRNFIKNSSYSLINISGLTLGLTVCLFIFLFVRHEMSYDKFLTGYQRVVRLQPTVTSGGSDQTWATSEGFVAPAVQRLYPEIEATTRLVRRDLDLSLSLDAKQFSESGSVAADSTFFDVFPIPFVYGDPTTALDKLDAIVLSRSTALKIFGNIDPVGKLLNSGRWTLMVTGVFEDLPDNSHFSFSVVLPLKAFWRDVDQSRDMYAVYTYIKVKSAEQIPALANKLLTDWPSIYGYVDEHGVAKIPDGFKTQFNLIPISDIHLASRAEKEFGVNGSLQIVYVFVAIAALILIVVVINYINLSNAMAMRRSKEVAIRKTIGASQKKLFVNFLLEAYGFSFVAVILSFGLVAVGMPLFNALTEKHFDPWVLAQPETVTGVFVVWIVLGFLSGFYPAMILSSFNPVQVLRSGTGVNRSGTVGLYLRRGLLISQFTISSLLVIAALTIQSQMHFIENLNVGFDKHNVVVLPVRGDLYEKREALKNAVNKLSEVDHSSFTSVVPGKRIVYLTVRVPNLEGSNGGGDDGTRDMRVMSVDKDFIKTLKLNMVQGRDFAPENLADDSSAFILNEAAVREFNLVDPIGKPFEYIFQANKKGYVIGIVKDFNFASAHSEIEPLMIHLLPWHSSLCVRLNTTNFPEAIKHIEEAWKSISSEPFDYSFLDQSYDAMYKADRTTGRLITYLTGLALTFACLGLFGVVSFFIEQRNKEVGIRKVLGASNVSLLNTLSREYILVVVVGNLLALFPAWYFINQWLAKFAFRIDYSPIPTLIAIGASGILAFLSIFHVIQKTARVNPAVILKNE